MVLFSDRSQSLFVCLPLSQLLFRTAPLLWDEVLLTAYGTHTPLQSLGMEVVLPLQSADKDAALVAFAILHAKAGDPSLLRTPGRKSASP